MSTVNLGYKGQVQNFIPTWCRMLTAQLLCVDTPTEGRASQQYVTKFKLQQLQRVVLFVVAMKPSPLPNHRAFYLQQITNFTISSKWNVLFHPTTLIQNRIIAPMVAKPFPSMSQHTKMLQKSRDPSGHFQVSDDLQKVAHYLPLLRRLSNNAEFRVWLSQVSWYLFTQLTSNWIFDSSCYRNKITEFCELPPAALHLWIWQDYHEKKSPLIFILFFAKANV